MTKQEQFFYDNAGYSYDPKVETEEQGHVRCAKELARAEVWFESSGLEYSVEPDSDADLSWMSDEERTENHDVVGVCLRTVEGEYTPFSLWGIVDATQEYLRVVLAELATEALPAYEGHELDIEEY